MRAVNLIPADVKPSAAGRSGGAVYVLLAGLALLVILAGAYVSTSNKIDDRKVEVSRVEAQAAAAEARAAALAPYSRFTELRATRVQTVSSLVASRFDWSSVFHEIARVIPSRTWLTGMKGTVGEDPTAGSQTVQATGKIPTIDITGCTSGHKSVARMMVRLRLMDRVAKVSLTSSNAASGDAAAAAAVSSGAATGGGCTSSKGRTAQFAVTVTFNPIAAPATSAGAAGGASATQPASTGETK